MFWERLRGFVPRTVAQWKQVGVFSLCAFLAFLFWCLNKLSKEYVTQLPCHMIVDDPPEGMLFDKTLQMEATLKVRGSGFSLLRLKHALRAEPIPISARNDFTSVMSPILGVDSVWPITPRVLQSAVSAHLPNSVSALELTCDTLYCSFSTVTRKQVPIRAQLTLKLAPQYMQTDSLRVIPDSVIVSGPKKMIEQLEYVDTKPLTLSHVRESFDIEVALERPSSLGYSVRKVQLQGTVEQFTQWEGRIPIKTHGAPDSLYVVLMPQDVIVSCHVPLSRYAQLQKEMFSLSIHIPKLSSTGLIRPIEIESAPHWVQNIEFTPKYSHYILKNR